MRIGLTISGAVSLGAFEGGALAALITGVQACQVQGGEGASQLRIDAIGAASAGSITAVLAARALSGGVDPVWVMEQAWVLQDSIQTLLTNADAAAPLSMDGLNEMAATVLKASPERINKDKVQRSPVTLHLALTNLRGLDYQIPRLSGDLPAAGLVNASTYLDWGEFTITPDWGAERFTQGADRSAVDTALASGASELGFPPKRLARSADDYANQGLINFPTDARYFWYTDGGTIDNEPLGRSMDLANEIDSREPLRTDERRVHLLIHPFPSSPPPATSLAWADENRRPTWIRTLVRAFSVIRAQNLFGDLRRAEKTNSRLVWGGRLQAAVEDLLAGMSDDEQKRWQTKLQELLDGIEAELSNLPRHRTDRPPAPDPQPRTRAAELFSRVLERVSGLAGKNPVGIEVVSPYLAVGTAGVALDQILAGELLESFGGFFDEGLRRSDFALGFVCMLNWMDTGLRSYGLTEGQRQLAVDEGLRAFYSLAEWTKQGATKGFSGYGLTDQLKSRAEELGLSAKESWLPRDFGATTLADLPIRERFELGRVAARIATVVGADVWLKATGRDKV